MIIDTSALLAIALREADAAQMVRAVVNADHRRMSAASYVEAGLKLVRLRLDAIDTLDRLLSALNISLIEVTPEQAREALRARTRYGDRPAQLNFGDCLVYALAKATGEPLLFKGEDFTHTDVQAVAVG